MVVLRNVFEIRFEFGHDARLALRGAVLPERRAIAIVLDELLLALQHELRKAAFRVGLDRLHLQLRGFLVVPVLRDEGAVRVGSIRIALFLDIQVAEACVQQVGIRPRRRAMLHEVVDGFRSLQIRERDRHHPERILDEFAIGAAQGLELDQGGRIALRHQHRIENSGERLQAAFVLALLEQRPTVFVQALVVVRRGRADFDHGLVGRLRRRIRFR